MPTYLVGPTRTYTTIQAAIDAVPSSIGGTGVHLILVDSGIYLERLAITTKTGTSLTDYIHVTCASGSEHNFNPNTGVIVRITNGNFQSIVVIGAGNKLSNVTLDDLSTVGTNPCVSQGASSNTLKSTCENVIGWSRGTAFSGGNNHAQLLYKCFALSKFSDTTTSVQGFWLQSDTIIKHKIYNCASFGYRVGFLGNSVSGGAVVNCWAIRPNGSSTSEFSLWDSASCSNNASVAAGAPGANSIQVTIDGAALKSQSTQNFHITKYSRYYGAGTSLSSIFTTDIDNEVITTWSIGPDALVDTTACQTDSWDYTILTASGSSPWAAGRNPPTTVTNTLQFAQNSEISRISLNGLASGNQSWVVSFQARLPTTSSMLYFTTGAQWQVNAFRPAIWHNASGTGANAFGYEQTGGTFGAFGSFTSATVIPGYVDTDYLTVTLYWKDTARQIAMVVSYGAASVTSGFVQLTLPGVGNNSQWTMGVRQTATAGVLAHVKPITWRADMTDAQVQLVYNGSATLCGDLSGIAPSTSSSPWRGETEKSTRQPDAKVQPYKTIAPATSPGRNNKSKQGEARAPSIKTLSPDSSPSRNGQGQRPTDARSTGIGAKKGYKDGFISVIPELGGYNRGTLGSGQKIAFFAEDLGINKHYDETNPVGASRQLRSHKSLDTIPSGGFSWSMRTNDCIPIFMSHFQQRLGTLQSGGTVYYEFSPTFDPPTLVGSSYGTGTYGTTQANAFPVSVYKAHYGTGFHYKSGLCDSLSFSFLPAGVAECKADFRFATSSIVGTASMTGLGSYSSLPHLPLNTASFSFGGLSIMGMQINSKANLQAFKPLGLDYYWYKPGRPQITGRVTVDKTKTSLALIGSMLAGASYNVHGTLSNSARDKFVFQMPNCRLDYFDDTIDSSTLEIPFKAYASDDGGTAPLYIKLWTQNYSATSFDPN